MRCDQPAQAWLILTNFDTAHVDAGPVPGHGLSVAFVHVDYLTKNVEARAVPNEESQCDSQLVVSQMQQAGPLACQACLGHFAQHQAEVRCELHDCLHKCTDLLGVTAGACRRPTCGKTAYTHLHLFADLDIKSHVWQRGSTKCQGSMTADNWSITHASSH